MYYTSMTKTDNDKREVTYENDDGVEVTVMVAQKWEICSTCGGNGKHDHPAFSNGISAEEFQNEWDHEEQEMYMRGAYDVRCDECDGAGKVLEVDFDSIKDPEVAAAIEREYDNARYDAAEREQERRMGA